MVVSLEREFSDLLKQMAADLEVPSEDLAALLLESALISALDR